MESSFEDVQATRRAPGTLKIVDCGDSAWNEAISRFPGYDIYDTSEYHQAVLRDPNHIARLFLYDAVAHRIAIPLVLRSIDPQLSSHQGWRDASSVYGYPGPLISNEEIPAGIKAAFQDAFTRALLQLGVVSVFSRLNPFRTCENVIKGLGEIGEVGLSIAINLTCCDEVRFKTYRKNHQKNILKLRASQAETIYDKSFCHFVEFKNLYCQEMVRLNARSYYHFDDIYFDRITSLLHRDLYLLIGKIADEITCGALFFNVGNIVHAHLAVTRFEYRTLSPLKLLFDDAASFFRDRGCRLLNIGGGFGGRVDGLFHFKKGFSNTLYPIKHWKWIVNRPHYEYLCSARGVEFLARTEGHFPRYRCKDELV